MHDVLTLWTPLLEESRNAAVVGYFMNWVELQDDARAAGGWLTRLYRPSSTSNVEKPGES